jgi:hypothetical protein
MIRAIVLVAALLVTTSARGFTPRDAAEACRLKGIQMQRAGERADAWQWFCMEENHLVFTGCNYSPSAIYRPECWVQRPAERPAA